MNGLCRTLLIPLLAIALCVSDGHADASANRAAMANAMTRMMEAMGFLGSGTDAARSMYGGQMPGMPSPFGMPGMGMGMPGWPSSGMPFTGGNEMDQAGRMGSAVMGRMPQMPWGGSILEGVWEAAGGGLLIVQGGNYRLYAPDGGFLDGRLQVTGDRVRMANPRSGFDLEFDYALDQGRLAMRDQGGQVYLYRRLVLNGGAD